MSLVPSTPAADDPAQFGILQDDQGFDFAAPTGAASDAPDGGASSDDTAAADAFAAPSGGDADAALSGDAGADATSNGVPTAQASNDAGTAAPGDASWAGGATTEGGAAVAIASGVDVRTGSETASEFYWQQATASGGGNDGDSPHGGGADAGAPEVIALDGFADARGGGGGGGGGGSTDPGVVTSYVSGDPNVANSAEYNISITFKGTWTSTLQKAFIDMSNKISSIITGDISDVFYRGTVIDDLNITAELKAIDGTGGILGQSGPTAIRTADYLPATATMQFDSADAATFNGMGLWDDIVVHEMLHCVGFGSIWGLKGLVAGSGTSNPTFTGSNAMAAYAALFGGTGAVPLEQDGGSGTAESHWDEQTFTSEIMTGYINLAGNHLSGMTVASLTDLGYQTTPWQTWQDWLVA